jgi:3-deoxy-manno-octulosonate cytidylyltransferase (CMP-KDO synthetase)
MRGDVIWTSPSCRNGTERIGEAVANDARLQNTRFIVNLQGDHPCTEPKTISAIVEALKNDSDASMSTAAALLRDRNDYLSQHMVKCVFDRNHNALYFSRAPIPYTATDRPFRAFGHIGIYCYRTPFLKKLLQFSPSPLQESEDLEQLKVLENGFRIKIAVVEETPLGVDTPQDLAKLEKILCPRNTSS